MTDPCYIQCEFFRWWFFVSAPACIALFFIVPTWPKGNDGD